MMMASPSVVPPAAAAAAAATAGGTAMAATGTAATALSKDAAPTQSLPVIHSIDLADDAQEDVFRLARQAVAQAKTHKERAQTMKKAMDKAHGPGKWHVVVGLSFGSYVTHQTGAFAFFSIDGISFLVFKG